MILTDMPEDLQMISPFFLRFSQKFSEILRFSLYISFFLRIFAPENPLPAKKGCGVIIFIQSIKKRCSPAV